MSLELLTGQHPFPARASFLELYDALFRQPEPRLEDTFTEDAQTFVAVQLRRPACMEGDFSTVVRSSGGMVYFGESRGAGRVGFLLGSSFSENVPPRLRNNRRVVPSRMYGFDLSTGEYFGSRSNHVST